MRTLFLKTSVILFFVTLLSVGLDVLYRKSTHEPYPRPRNLFILPEAEHKYTLVKVGNSHAEDGITFAKYNVRARSLSSVSQPFEYDLAVLKMHSREIAKGAVIIINASPISFSQAKSGRDDSIQISYYDGRLSPFLIPQLNIETYMQSRFLPFLRAGYAWRYAYGETVKNRLTMEQRSPTPTPLPGALPMAQPVTQVPITLTTLVPDPIDPVFNAEAIGYDLLPHPAATPSAKLVESMNFMFRKWYETGGFDPKYFQANRRDLERLIRYCRERKWRPIVITIPISGILVDGLLDDYMQKYLYENISKTDVQGAEYWDFSRDVRFTENQEYFANSDHLNGRGAAAFSYVLLRRLIDRGYLPQSADGYDYRPLSTGTE